MEKLPDIPKIETEPVIPINVPNDPSDLRFWAFWHEVRLYTCPEDSYRDYGVE